MEKRKEGLKDAFKVNRDGQRELRQFECESGNTLKDDEDFTDCPHDETDHGFCLDCGEYIEPEPYEHNSN